MPKFERVEEINEGLVCRKCKKSISEIYGYLTRVNPKGETPAVWECSECSDPSENAEIMELLQNGK